MKNKKQVKTTTKGRCYLCVCMCVCEHKQNSWAVWWIDWERKRTKERKRRERKRNVLFAMQRQISPSLSLCWFFLHREAIVAAGCYLSRYIWRERTHSCFNRR